MDPIHFAINSPVKIAVGVILIVMFGLLSILEVPVQLTPDVDKPVITVQTNWSGASPQEIESEIIDRQEDKLKSVSNLWKMTSESSQGQGKIKLEFPVSVNKDIAYRDVSDKLRQVSGYPDEVDEPVMSATDNDMANTIAWIMLYSSKNEDITRLKTFITDNVKPQLERADGISEVDVYGGRDREIQVVVDAHLIAARGITLREVEQALRGQNKNISAGVIEQGKRDYTYRTIGEYKQIEDIADTVIAYKQGGPVRVRDVAEVVDGFKRPVSFVRSKGRPVLAIPARRETGANIIEAMNNLKERIEAVNREILHPRGLGLELTQVYDETTYIWSAIWLVLKNMVIGGALAVAVLLLFLRSGSATGIIAVAIPISVIGTFFIIGMLGRSLNVVLLAGMAFAVGMVVDNAIVVLENIYRHRSMGKTRAEAAFDGASEVWGAILASTLTTIAVFLPVVFIEEEAGQLFKDIAIAISSAVGLSLLVSVLVIPPLAARFFRASKVNTLLANKPWKPAQLAGHLVTIINRHTWFRLAIVIGIPALSLLGSWKLMPAAEYLPAGNKNLVFGFLLSPPGYSIEEFRRMAMIVEDGDPNDPADGIRPSFEAALGSQAAAQLPKVHLRLGEGGKTVKSVTPPPIDNFFFVSFSGGAFMGCTSKVTTNVKPLETVMRNAGSRIPGVFSVFQQTSLFGGGASGGNSVDVEVRSDNRQAVVAAAQAIQREVMNKGYGYPRPSPANFDLGKPEIQIIPDRAKAADLGLDVRDIGFIVEAGVDGAFVGEFNDHGDKIDMVIKIAGTQTATMEQIGQLPIATPSNHVVPIASAVSFKRTTAPQQINHIEEMKSVSLAVVPKTGVPLQTTMEEIENDIIAPLRQRGIIPKHVFTSLAGTASKLTQTKKALIGDFEGVVQQPRLFGWSVTKTVGAIILGALALILLTRIAAGYRPAKIVTITLGITLVIGFLAVNPQLAVTIMTSRAILALFITYLLMAALFESFAYPFVIMFSVPLAAVGGFAALRIVHQVSLFDVSAPIQQLDVLTMLGFVILVGIVVNNAILIVHQALTYQRRDGIEPRAAIALSVQTRTRPIVMSSMTSIFGMAPLVIMPGAGSELYRGLGSVILGGLLVSTLFTLIVVPAIYTLFLDIHGWTGDVRRAGASSRLPLPSVTSAPVVSHSPDV